MVGPECGSKVEEGTLDTFREDGEVAPGHVRGRQRGKPITEAYSALALQRLSEMKTSISRQLVQSNDVWSEMTCGKSSKGEMIFKKCT